jgi:hypothetical protein
MGNEERRMEVEELGIMKAESLVMNEGLMTNEMMKEGWMAMNRKSIMNEEWRMIMNKMIKEPTTDEEFMIGWSLGIEGHRGSNEGHDGGQIDDRGGIDG